jgi:phosphocarrier protein
MTSQSISRTLYIANKRGLHARASSKFAVLAGSFEDTQVRVIKEDQEVAGDSIMDLMMLAAGIGQTIEVIAEGPHAEACLDALDALVSDLFGEGE